MCKNNSTTDSTIKIMCKNNSTTDSTENNGNTIFAKILYLFLYGNTKLGRVAQLDRASAF